MRRDRVTQELNLHMRLQHPNIINLVDTYETPGSYALVLEMYGPHLTLTLRLWFWCPPF